MNEKQPFQMIDISAQTFGKYQHCTMHKGLWYADADFDVGYGVGTPKSGSLPSPWQDTPEKVALARRLHEEAAQAAASRALKAAHQPKVYRWWWGALRKLVFWK